MEAIVSPEASEVRTLAREWFAAAAGGRLGAGPYSSFISVWIAFNALYAFRFDNIEADRKQIRAFARWGRAKREHQRLLRISDYPVSIEVLSDKGVYNYRNQGFLHIHDANDLWQVLEAVYQVRCNLFHGRKSATDMRDQALVEASRLITYRFVGALLDDDTVWDDI